MAGHIGDAANLDWCTPEWVRDGAIYVNKGCPIDLDPCSNPWSIMGAKVNYLLPANDGLQDPWNVYGRGTFVYVNPPFGKCYVKPDRSDVIGAKTYSALKKADKENGTHLADEYSIHTSIADWVWKANAEWQNNGTNTVMLLPAAVDTAHWQDGIFPLATSRCFIRGRVRFLDKNHNPGGPAPMACALVYWGDAPDLFEVAFEKKGSVKRLN